MKLETASLIEHYLQRVHQLSLAIASSEASEHELLALVDQCVHDAAGDLISATFFRAERCFYKKRYKEALTEYLKVKTIPHHHFFCYRASAFLSAECNRREEALNYAKRALMIQHHDLETLRLCKELGSESKPAQEFNPAPESLESVALATEEFDALANIFRDDQIEQSESPLDMSSEKTKPAPQMPSPQIALTGGAIEERIRAFMDSQQQLLQRYREQSDAVARQKNLLLVLSGWPEREEIAWLTEGPPQCQGGYYVRWHGTGIVINPGKNFLQRFHQQGLHLRDIDCVIVTSPHAHAYADIRAICDFNRRLNQGQRSLHVIRYYLHQQAHQHVARDLKPIFKQEAGSVHSLELYLDSPESESIQLNNAITLHYFPTSTKGVKMPIGICLQLHPSASHEQVGIRLGYVSGTAWSPQLTHYLQGCDIIVAGIERCGTDDIQKKRYNEESLGYYGISSLIQELSPRLFLCSEFSAEEGDLRLELIQKMRQEVAAAQNSVLLPADTGLRIDLISDAICCSVTNREIHADKVRVAKSRDTFGALRYLSLDCLI